MTNMLQRESGNAGSERDRRNTRRLRIWTLAWGASFLLATLALARDWWSNVLWTLAVVGVSLVLGAGAVLAYRRFLIEADELRRKIELEALALAFGVGILGGLSYWLLEVGGLVADADLAVVLAAMMATQGLAVALGQWRYR